MIINRECLLKIDNLIEKYIAIEVKREFLNDVVESEILLTELMFLGENAIILSQTNNFRNKQRALKIATILVKITENKQLNLVASIVFGRLKNFKVQEMVFKRKKYSLKEEIYSIELLQDFLYRKNNTIKIANTYYTLNDFQVEFYDKVKTNKNVSVSAPTSIGKSFIVKRIIIDLLLNELNCCAYIVPSRALISEVINDIRKEINELNMEIKFNLTSSSDLSSIDKKLKTILVLTQERLYQICNNNEIDIDVLIIDEAQNVMNGSRGVLLEYSIKYAKKLWKNMRTIFISPLIKDPERFLEKFSEDSKGAYVFTRESSVRQNIIKLYMGAKGYDVVVNNNQLNLKANILRPTSNVKRFSNVVINFNNGENSILYCNTTDLAVEVCKELCECGKYEDLNIKELNDFADFIEYSINKDYLLSKYIRKGIVYHYGDLPPFVRSGIEELASKGYFKIIACTSTLLQGVNIPAQNIYVYNPSNYKTPLSNLEFWNLIGRAGRMGHDFVGNIILIQNKKWNDIDRYDDNNSKLEFVSDRFRESDILKKILEDDMEDISNIYDKDDIDEVRDIIVNSTLINKLNKEDIFNKKDTENEEYEEVEKVAEKIIDNFTAPKILLMKLVGVRYENINSMWNYFQLNDKNIEDFIPIHPLGYNGKKFLNNYKKIIEIINSKLMNYKLYGENDFDKLVYMSYSWIIEDRMRKILLYKKKNDSEEVILTSEYISKTIKKQIKYLNNNIRFKLVKGFYSYEEILKEYLLYTNREHLITKIANIPLYLEIGACKKSTIELISNGLNRDFAIEITKRFKIRDNRIIEDIKKIDYEEIKNNYLRLKIKEFISMI